MACRNGFVAWRGAYRLLQRPLSTSRSPGRPLAFSTSASRPAVPSGPPPSGFRLPRPKRWDESDESALDKAGRLFLLTEMFRGMYVVLEQFFRPPYTILYPFEKVCLGPMINHRTEPHPPTTLGPDLASFQRRACSTALSYRRRTVYRLQAL